jgi:hypothetical protein
VDLRLGTMTTIGYGYPCRRCLEPCEASHGARRTHQPPATRGRVRRSDAKLNIAEVATLRLNRQHAVIGPRRPPEPPTLVPFGAASMQRRCGAALQSGGHSSCTSRPSI